MTHPARSITPSNIADLKAFADSRGSLPDDSAQDANTRRAAHAAEALAAYADGAAFDEQIGDLLADLLHLSDALGEDPDELLDSARRRYGEELTGKW